MKAMWMVVCVAVVVALCAPAAAVESFDTLLPEGTVLYVSVRDVPQLLTKLEGTAGYKIYRQLKIFERLMPPDRYAEMAGFYERFVKPLGGVFRGELALAIVSMGVAHDGPDVALLVDVSESREALDEYLEGTIYPLLEEKGIEPEELKQGTLSYTRITPRPDDPEEAIYFAVKDDVLVATVREETLAELLTATGPGVARAMLPANEGYADVRRALGDADMTIYVNVGAIITRAVEESGGGRGMSFMAFPFEPLRAFGIGTTIGPGGGGGSTVRLATDGPPSGYLSLFAREAVAFKSLKRAPAEAGFYYAIHLGSLEELYGRVVQMLEGWFSDQTGGEGLEEFTAGVEKLEVLLGMNLEDEILPAFGGEIALVAKVPEALGIPPAALLIEVKDKEMVEKLVARVFELLETFGEGGVRLTTAEYAGVEITTVLASPAITPAVAVLDDFLVVGTSADAVRTIIDTADGETIEKRDDFRTTMAPLPTSGTAMAYIDLKEVYEFVFPLLAAQAPADGRMGELIKDLGKVGEHLSGFGAVVTGDESGLTYRTYSKNVLFEPLLIFGAGMVLPALSRAQGAAQSAASMANVKQLCLAMMMYAQDHDDRLPERLSDLALYVGDPAVFVHPKNRKKAKLIDLEKPVTIDEHSDYELLLKDVKLGEIEDTAEAVVIREKREFSKGRRVVGYADGHVTNFPPGTNVFDHIPLDEE